MSKERHLSIVKDEPAKDDLSAEDVHEHVGEEVEEDE